MKKIVNLLMVFIIAPIAMWGQNTIVTDDDSYIGNNSAVLDVYSKTKGLLAPRMNSIQRASITTPAEGLLVFDTDADTYYYYANSAWHTINAPSLWSENTDTVHLADANKRVGVGTTNPLAKLTVQGDASLTADEPLFEVKNSAGDVIFAVYENEVKVNFKEGAKGVKGGFAVGGLTDTKATPTEYMRITQDSVRIYIKDPAKGVKGGFAVGGLTDTKAGKNNYLTIERDSTRIYVDNSVKGVKGGFAVGGLTDTKAGNSFLNLTSDNYLIGQGAGNSLTTGQFNSFMGYEAGFLSQSGMQNIFIGYKAGHTNESGNWNTFLGFEAGLSNTGSDNTFIGYKAGRAHTFQGGNVHIGSKAGEFATNGEQNIFIGESSGAYNETGSQNVFMGFKSGFENRSGKFNVYIGSSTFQSSTSSSQNVAIGNNVGVDVTSTVTSSVIMGDNALTNLGSGIPVLNSTFIGKNVGINIGTGATDIEDCIFLGTNAGDGIRNTEWDHIEGIVAVGNSSGANADGYRNVFIGYEAGSNFTGHQNTMLGYQVGTGNGSGTYNVYIGDQVAKTTVGDDNTFIGRLAGAWVSGDNNVFIGNRAGIASQVSPRTESNRLRIGINNLIYGEFDNRILEFNGDVGIGKTPAYELDVDGDVNVSAGSDYLINGTSISTQWTTNGSNIYYSGGNVGIGTSSPSAPLEIKNYGGDALKISHGSYLHGLAIDPWASSISAVNIDPTEEDQSIYFGRDVTASKWVFQSGDVGIGTTSPAAAFHLNNSSGDARMRLSASSGYSIIDFYNGTTYKAGMGFSHTGGHFFIYSGGNLAIKNGRVGISTTDPSYYLQLQYNSAAKPTSSTWTIYSDRRLKDISGNYNKGLTEILRLNPVIYRYKKDNGMGIKSTDTDAYGLIAQDVESVFPEAVGKNDKGFLDLDMHPIFIAQINAIKELNMKLEEQQLIIHSLKAKRSDKLPDENEIENLKKENTDLKLRLERIEKMLEQLNMKVAD
jgi:hypothetical protein